MTKHCFDCGLVSQKDKGVGRGVMLSKECPNCKIQAPRQSMRPSKPVRKQPRGK